MTSMKEVRAALKQALGFAPGDIRYGERYDMDCEFKPSYPIVDMREWPENSDLDDHPDLTAAVLKDWASNWALYPNGIIVDLYVYRPLRKDSGGDLETNCTLVLGTGGELLTVYDSVGKRGQEYDEWWCQARLRSHGTEGDD